MESPENNNMFFLWRNSLGPELMVNWIIDG